MEGEQSYNGHSSYQAESVAIWNGLAAAVDFFGENKPQFENHSSLNILTDSMLSLLQHLEKLQFHQMMISQPIQEIVRCLGLATDKLFKTIIFTYVPGHKGLAMNEYVDALASTQLGKHTLHMPPETDDLQIPYSVLKSSFRNRTSREFKRYLERAVTQSGIRSNPSRHNFKNQVTILKLFPARSESVGSASCRGIASLNHTDTDSNSKIQKTTFAITATNDQRQSSTYCKSAQP